MATREEHMRWAKDRALEYVERGEVFEAWASMASDLNKHDELRNHSALMLGAMLVANGGLNTPAEMRKFIEGCN